MALLERANRALTRVEDGCAWIAGAALLAILAIVAFDVTRRYVFNSPLAWAHDLIGNFLLPAAFFFIASQTFRRDGHIAIDVVYLRRSRRTQRRLRLLAAIVSIPVVTLMLGLAARESVTAWRNDEMLVGSILWPAWIPPAILVAGFGVLLVRLALDGAALAVAMVRLRGDGPVPGESPERALHPGTVEVGE